MTTTQTCGAVFPATPGQAPCGKLSGHENGPDTDWKRDYHSNGMLKWRVDGLDLPPRTETTPATHPMEYPDTGLPISTDRMRRRVADLIGDETTAAQVLAEMAHWATRCAEVKRDGGDGSGSNRALWMRAVLAPVEDDAYDDDDDGEGL